MNNFYHVISLKLEYYDTVALCDMLKVVPFRNLLTYLLVASRGLSLLAKIFPIMLTASCLAIKNDLEGRK